MFNIESKIMALEYKSLEEVLSTIEVKEGLNKDNIIKELKTKLEKQDQGLYKEWEKDEFGVNHGFSLNISGIEYSKLPLLIIAARNGYTKTVNALIQAGANVNAVDQCKRTPLHHAALNGRVDTVEVLIKERANVNAVDKDKRTPLDHAALNGYVDIENALITAGANVNAVDKNGITYLEYAKMHIELYAKSESVVKALLDAGGRSFVKARNKAMIAGGVNTLLGTSIAVALFTTGTITAQLIPIVIAVVAVTAAALVVGYATYELLKPSTKVDGAEKSSAALINGQQGVC
ncbi:ankyrin repeat domain-containing protein [Wolbachia endosymbiont of Drosophila mauritiana]|nr:ankyrin repeat domain-containing protein [Wolbachia endosymbiont of Drosophila mauritiana]QCB64016.1 ankyrin repeat domain-containing protein [Wolbachia endosymbiont of Drosophila mauritiana]QWE33719.1 Ankyrin repeat domain protein [Wolbachia endosymbiont of Drosophila simulans]TGB06164.1 ankyrin repeat domain-containing protein [Wolbachia endosymbiont of Drosophila mauritiana]